MSRHVILAGATALISSAFLLVPGGAAEAKKEPAPDHVTFHSWSFRDDTIGGTYDGTIDSGPALTLSAPTQHRTYTDPYAADPAPVVYDEGDWTSPPVDTAYGLTQAVASWNAHTPGGSWIEVDLQGVTPDGTTSTWYVMGRWADDDIAFHPTTVSGQGDTLGTVSVDTFVAAQGVTFDSYRLRVELMRPQGSDVTPSLGMVGAMASAVPDLSKQPTSPTTMTGSVVLDVPTYSQELHRGEFPEYDNGGEAWCSPTSTSMVVASWGRGPSDSQLQYVRDRYPDVVDPQVDFAARHVFDHSYDGAGNWPFNTAYAATYGLDGFVTRLRNLAEAEQFIKAGIPLVVSLSFKKNELDGAGYGTGGHLMSIVGFTADGDVVANDPASHLVASDDQVRVTYDRAQFEHAWLTSSQGVVYVIHPSDVPLPPAPAEANW
ncbi:MAG TPA: peptidase C39 family protein [Nocardioides sp.]|uniref:peptidase C39 family protein n=1 Tax=Nocardioides sp. TaxID=35761 RepID=UPI002F4024AD